MMKMRLIDADKLPFEEVWSWESGTFQPTTGEIVDGKAIREAPTVKAITIEWIRDYMLKLPDGSEAYECILVMLENWEKENGE